SRTTAATSTNLRPAAWHSPAFSGAFHADARPDAGLTRAALAWRPATSRLANAPLPVRSVVAGEGVGDWGLGIEEL
ncbi:MAG: hypothetical protein ABSA70_13880, partial [Terriglobia bacterium]